MLLKYNSQVSSYSIREQALQVLMEVGWRRDESNYESDERLAGSLA